MRRRKPLPLRSEVARYWCLGEGLKRCPELGGVVIAWEEPVCFGCNYWAESWCGDTPEEAWNATPLERAHIIAHSAGGSDDVANLVLLCRDCHDEAPVTNDPEMMLTWILKNESHEMRWWKPHGRYRPPVRREQGRSLDVR